MTSPDGKAGYIPLERQQDAVKAGFKLSGPPAQSDAGKWYGFTPGNLISNVGTGLKQMFQGVNQGLQDIGGAVLPQALGGDPINNMALVHHIVDPMQAEQAKAQALQTSGHTALAVAHATASGVPILGPWAANLAEQAATGDVGGAVARGGTQLLAPKVIGPAAELVTKGASRAALLGKTPEGAYESALKPSTTLSQADRATVVQAGLQNEIPVSKAGLEKLGDLIDDYNQKIKDQIASDPTRPIDPNAVATRTASARARFAKQVNAQPDLNAIEASKQQFLTEQGQKPGVPAQPTGLVDAQGNPIMRPAQPPQPAPPMNAADAQAMKQGTYGVLKGKFGEQGSAAVEAQKALARGLKEEIASQFPEINNLNAAESKLLDLQPILERAVSRISNHQIIGIGTPVTGAAAKAVTGSGSAAVVASALKAVLDNPTVKSRIAIAVSKSSKVPIGQAMARVQAYSSALAVPAAGLASRDAQAYSSADNPSQPTTPQP
jgi:hypothetical protein